jgi:hypothetical protein
MALSIKGVGVVRRGCENVDSGDGVCEVRVVFMLQGVLLGMALATKGGGYDI